MATYRNLDELKNSPEMGAAVEAGIGVAAQQWERLFNRIDPALFGDNRALNTFLYLVTEVIPEPAIDGVSYFLAEYFKRHPSLSTPMRVTLASLAQSIPDTIQDMKRKGTYTKDAFKAELTTQAKDKLVAVETKYESENGWLETTATNRVILHRSGRDHAPPKGARERELLSLLRDNEGAIRARRVHMCDGCFDEVEMGPHLTVTVKGPAPAAPKADLSALSERGQENLALLQRINDARSFDLISRPFGWRIVNACLAELASCPAALKVLDSIEIPPEQRDSATGALTWLERIHAAGGLATLDADDLVEYGYAVETVEGVLNHFGRFLAILRIEAKTKVDKLTWVTFSIRDNIDDAWTAETRNGLKKKFLGFFKNIGDFLTQPSCLRSVAIFLIVLVLLVIPFTFVLNLLLFAISGWVAIDWGLADGSFYWFNAGVVGVFIARLLIVTFDWVLTGFRKIGDFLNPADGTGIIGGTIREIGDSFRRLTGRELTAAQIEARLQQEAKASEPVDAFHKRALTVTIVTTAVAAGGNFWLFMDRDPVLGVFLMIGGFVALMVAEVYSRAYKLLSTEDRLNAVRMMIRVGSKLAAAIVVVGVLWGTVRVIVGPVAVSNTATLVRAASEKVVIETAKAAEVPLNDQQKAEYEYKALLDEACQESKGRVLKKNKTACKDAPNVFPCDCTAEIPESVLKRNPKLLNKPPTTN